MNTLTLLAQAPAGGQSPFSGIFMMIIIMVMMWVVLIRPQQKQRKELAAKVAAMKIGDKAITAGGIHGLVHKIKDTTVTLKVAEGTMIEFEKSGIQNIVTKSSKATAADKAEPTKGKVIDAEEA